MPLMASELPIKAPPGAVVVHPRTSPPLGPLAIVIIYSTLKNFRLMRIGYRQIWDGQEGGGIKVNVI